MYLEMHPETAVGQLKAGDYTFPLQAVDVKGSVRGLLYSAIVRQTFHNTKSSRLEAEYIFPLPPKAAVHGFIMKVGEREIVGEIKERGQARRDYQQAIQQGHRAAMLEEDRSDIFTATVGNIGPGETVEISFELSGPLSCFQNTARLRLPLVVGEVYVPGKVLAGASVGGGVEADTDQVPDASRITPPRLADGAPNPVALTLSFDIEPAGLDILDTRSTCHFARTKVFEDGRRKVSLLPGVEKMDKAFVLEVTYPKEKLQTSLLVDKENRAFCLTVVPPVSKEVDFQPRDVVIVLDRSGSMEGWSMIAARRAAHRIVEGLNREDRFAIVAFDNACEHFSRKQGLVEANDFYKMRAAEFLSKIDARGGTEALPALSEGLSYLSDLGSREPHMIFLTDGEVANDSAIIRQCQAGVRISTVGIGYAAREGLLNRMAEVSGGLCSLIPNEADLESELVNMHRKWGQPVWKGLSLKGADEAYRSPKFWDVWQDVPTTFFGRLDENYAEELVTTEVGGWRSGRGHSYHEVTPLECEDPVIFRSWARSRLLDLEDLFAVHKASPQEMVELSLESKVLCRFTAFTAIDNSEVVDMKLDLDKLTQPVEQTTRRSSLKRRSAQAPRSRSAEPSPGAWLGGDRLEEPCEEGWLSNPAPARAVPLGEDCFSDSWCDDEVEFPSESKPGNTLGTDLQSESLVEFLSLNNPLKRLRELFSSGKKPEISQGPDTLGAFLREFLEVDAGQGAEDLLVRLQAVIDKIAEMLRSGAIDKEDEVHWKSILSQLLDYQELLKDPSKTHLAEQVRRELVQAV